MRTPFGTCILLSTILYGSTFNFKDFDFFQESSDAIQKSCPKLGAAIKLIPLYRPNIDKIVLHLRTGCVQTGIPINETEKFNNIPEFDVNKETVVLVAGWRSNPNEDYIEDMVKAYNCRGGHNFFVVDTESYLSTEYIKSASNIEKLGEFVAQGLVKLGVSASKIHLIGHSLGAHIVGSAGRTFYSETGTKIKRITGLDPARPCFATPSVFPPLSSDDADFVDIIHSNPGELGIDEAIGHIDFYPDGLEDRKPGCSHLNLKCSHVRSIEYFTESAVPGNEYNFVSMNCNTFEDLEARNCSGSTLIMGYAATNEASMDKSIYYVPVEDKQPFGNNVAPESAYTSTENECGLCLDI